jgi:hypothetical protein
VLWSFLSNDGVVLDWSLWLRVLGGISNNGRVGLDGGGVHWDFFLLFLLSWLSILLGILGWLSVLLGVLRVLFGILGSCLLVLLWSSLFFGLRIGFLLVLGHIFGKGLDKIIRELSLLSQSNTLSLVPEESKNNKGTCNKFHFYIISKL